VDAIVIETSLTGASLVDLLLPNVEREPLSTYVATERRKLTFMSPSWWSPICRAPIFDPAIGRLPWTLSRDDDGAGSVTNDMIGNRSQHGPSQTASPARPDYHSDR
jgi:hypothetical protein